MFIEDEVQRALSSKAHPTCNGPLCECQVLGCQGFQFEQEEDWPPLTSMGNVDTMEQFVMI